MSRTFYRRHLGILALLAALACLAGCATGELMTPPAGPATPRHQAASPSGTVISWPADGGSAADIGGTGVTDGPGATRQVPIASVAKVMTAYVILRDHPLNGGGPGPDITVQPSEAAAYPAQARAGDSLVPVVAGETITERQALEALLLPSADNMAWILARWDAGRQAAFVAKMNAAARHQAGGRETLIVAATLGQPGTAATMLPNALQAGHDLVLALDRALA